MIPHHPIVQELEPLEDIVHAPLISVDVKGCHIVVKPGGRLQGSQTHIGTAFPVWFACYFLPILLGGKSNLLVQELGNNEVCKLEYLRGRCVA